MLPAINSAPPCLNTLRCAPIKSVDKTDVVFKYHILYSSLWLSGWTQRWLNWDHHIRIRCQTCYQRIYASLTLFSIGSVNGLSPLRHQANNRTIADLLLNGPSVQFEHNFNQNKYIWNPCYQLKTMFENICKYQFHIKASAARFLKELNHDVMAITHHVSKMAAVTRQCWGCARILPPRSLPRATLLRIIMHNLVVWDQSSLATWHLLQSKNDIKLAYKNVSRQEIAWYIYVSKMSWQRENCKIIVRYKYGSPGCMKLVELEGFDKYPINPAHFKPNKNLIIGTEYIIITVNVL